LRCGLSIRDYEYMTPYELMLAVEEYQDRMRIEHELMVMQAYLTAAWQRSKRMPKLADVLRKTQPKGPQHQQTPEEMLAVMMQFHRARKGGER
jgi:hypothetical protein